MLIASAALCRIPYSAPFIVEGPFHERTTKEIIPRSRLEVDGEWITTITGDTHNRDLGKIFGLLMIVGRTHTRRAVWCIWRDFQGISTRRYHHDAPVTGMLSDVEIITACFAANYQCIM